MTTVRHIPEDELHAHLDQALSRSQCIEIETHLASCGPCRRQRDQVAALRDRTTAVLAAGSLQRRVETPPYPLIAERAGQRRQAGWRRRGVMAASVAVAMIAGWGMRALLDPHVEDTALPVARAVVAAAPSLSPVSAAALPRRVVPRPAPASDWERGASPVRLAAGGMAALEPPSPAPMSPPAPTNWDEVSLPEAAEATGSLVPSLPDLTVSTVRLQPVSELERPILEVTQRRADGETLITLEGPVGDVARLVAGLRRQGWSSSTPARSLADYLEVEGAVRRTSRVVAVLGRLPTDTLNALVHAVVIR